MSANSWTTRKLHGCLRKLSTICGYADSFRVTVIRIRTLPIRVEQPFSNRSVSLQLFVKELPSLRSWATWWIARRNMTFDPFRDCRAPKSNQAEAGNTTFRKSRVGKNMFLVQSVRRDILQMVNQDREIYMHTHQKGKIRLGRGPSRATLNERAKRMQMSMAEAFGAELNNTLAMGMEVSPLNSSLTFQEMFLKIY